jgi:putative membrane protein
MIKILVNIGVAIIAILHLWFFILEIFFWKKPLGLKIFKMSQEFAYQSATLAANQGVYNGFLSAGLLWGLLSRDPVQSFHVKVFFLSCVLIAGIYAGLSVSRRILFIQALSAAVTLLLLYFSV